MEDGEGVRREVGTDSRARGQGLEQRGQPCSQMSASEQFKETPATESGLACGVTEITCRASGAVAWKIGRMVSEGNN